MTIETLGGELAAEHRRDLLRQAADHRWAASATAHRQRRASGLTVRTRPLRRADAVLLADIFARLSPASRAARFLAVKRKLTDSEMRYLTDIDHHDHEALIALTRWRKEAVGVARFIRDPADPASAEVAVEVVDAWQGHGVGSLLVTRLAARARCEGVAQFIAVMEAGNVRSRRLLGKLGEVSVVARDGATLTYRVVLASTTVSAVSRPSTLIAPPSCA